MSTFLSLHECACGYSIMRSVYYDHGEIAFVDWYRGDMGPYSFGMWSERLNVKRERKARKIIAKLRSNMANGL